MDLVRITTQKLTGPRDQDAQVVNDPSIFGGCPECGKNDGYRNVGRYPWFFCLLHKTCWLFGSTQLHSWQIEQAAFDWEWHKAQFSEYRQVPYCQIEPPREPSD